MNNLPPGFTVDPPSGGLPPGFTVDKPSPPPKAEPDSFWSRFGTGVADPIYGAAQIADKAINPIRQMISPGASSMEDVIRERDANYRAPEGWDLARMGGNVANPISWAGGGVGGAALQAALQPTAADDDIGTFAVKKVGQAGLGAVMGRVLGGKATPEAKQLADQGVRLSPGQAAGGIENSLEQKMTSLPFTGSVLDKARQRAISDVQSKAIERATGIEGVPSVRDANQAVSNLFDKVVPKLGATPEGFKGGFDGAIDALGNALKNPELTAENRKLLEGVVTKHLDTYPGLDGRGLKNLDSTLGFLARKYDGPTATPADQAVADGIYEVISGMRDGWAKGLTGEEAATFAQANRGFRKMIPINRAASTRADEIATPRALEKAFARQAGKDVTRMPADPLIDPAIAALQKNVNDSGTAGRLASMSIPAVATGLAAWPVAAAVYSPVGRAILTGKGGPTREALARALVAAERGYSDED